MKEVTLKKAIELCEKYGGRAFRKHNGGEFHIGIGGNIYDTQGNAFCFHSDDFEMFWIYKPPEQSAFMKWNQKTGFISSSPFAHRKEGWNAGINAAIDKLLRIKIGLKSIPELCEELKEIKEND